jgi:hypothetical protein
MPNMNEIYRIIISTDSAPAGTFPAGTLTKILSFARLPFGWHYGEGRPIDKKVIQRALAILWRLYRLADSDAFPGSDGEIMVTGYEGDHYIEAIVENDGSVSLTYEFKDSEIFAQERMSAEEADAKLMEIAGQIWNISAFYIPIISTVSLSKIASRAWLSETPQTRAAFLSFNAPAWTPPMPQSAPTQEPFIPPRLRENRPFFGYLTKASFLQDTA